MIKKGIILAGGSIHNGHLEIVKFFLNKKILSDVIFVITPQNPFKSEIKYQVFYHLLT